jgi:hypothetical protein
MVVPNALGTKRWADQLTEEQEDLLRKKCAEISMEQGYMVTSGQLRDFTAVAAMFPHALRDKAEFDTFYLAWRIYGDDAKQEMDKLIAEYGWVTEEIVLQDFRVRFGCEERGYLWTPPTN